VPEPLPVRVRDDGALVTDHRLVQLGRLEEAAHRLHHPAGDDDHVQPGVARLVQRLQGARPQRSVLPDEGAVEVRRDDVQVAREVVG
jgi:hypothetical protein